jgi:hypothetical protein
MSAASLERELDLVRRVAGVLAETADKTDRQVRAEQQWEPQVASSAVDVLYQYHASREWGGVAGQMAALMTPGAARELAAWFTLEADAQDAQGGPEQRPGFATALRIARGMLPEPPWSKP